VDLAAYLSGEDTAFHGIFALAVAPDKKDEVYLGTQK
jgi:hypothetical protein